MNTEKKVEDTKLNILVIGAGMYVCGKGTAGYGTIFPALCEWQRRGLPIGKVYLAATSTESSNLAKQKINSLNQLMGTELSLTAFPSPDQGIDPAAYLCALKEIEPPACAIVVVPDHLHFEVTENCLKSGLHTLVVKPFTPTVEEANKLIGLQQTRNLYGAVEFHKRFDRANLKMKELIKAGKLGRPLYFIVEFSQRKSVPSGIFSSWVAKTNIFQYLGVHYVDIIYFVTGAAPRRAMAMGQKGWLEEGGIDAYDAIHGTVEWEYPDGNSFVSYIFTNWVDPESTSAMSDQKIKVIGTLGRYESDQKRRGISVVTDQTGFEELNPDFCSSYPSGSAHLSYQGYGIDSIHTFIRDVIDLNLNRITLNQLELKRPTFKESIVSTGVIEAVNRSLESSGEWIKITS